MNISYPTAKGDLEGLVKLGYVKPIAVNKIKHIYIRSDNFDTLINS